MKAQPDFWYNFPIFLPDHASYGQNQQQPQLAQPFLPQQPVMYEPEAHVQ